MTGKPRVASAPKTIKAERVLMTLNGQEVEIRIAKEDGIEHLDIRTIHGRILVQPRAANSLKIMVTAW